MSPRRSRTALGTLVALGSLGLLGLLVLGLQRDATPLERGARPSSAAPARASTPALSPGPAPVPLARPGRSLLDEGVPRRDVQRAHDAGPELVGVVLEASGQGIAAARVRLLRDDPAARFGLAPSIPLAQARSDAQGRFALPLGALASGDALWLAADAPGFAPQLCAVEGGGEARLWLRRAGRVRGRVREASGAPVEGATILCDAPCTDAEGGWFATTRVTTDAAGAFVLERLPEGEARTLEVLARDGRRSSATLARPVPEREIELCLGAARERAVLLRERESGRALSDRRVLLHGVLELRTDAEGRLSWLRGENEPSVVELALEKRGTVLLAARRLGTSAAPTVVEVPGVASVLRGHVLTAAGLPLAGARVRASVVTTSEDPGPDQKRFASEHEGLCDARGAFALALHASPTSSVRLVVEHPGFLPALYADSAPALCDTSLELRLEPCASIAGRLRAAPGVPMPPALAWEGPSGAGRATLGPDGSFRIQGLPGGAYRLHAAWGSTSAAASELARLVLVAGEERVLALELAEPRALVSGTLLEPDGRPVLDGEVEAWARDGARDTGSCAVRTDAQGRFTLPLPADPALVFDLEARKGQRVARLSGVAGGTSGLVLRLPAGGRLQLLVRDAHTLAALEGVSLAWRAEPSQPFVPLHGDARLRFGDASGRIDEEAPLTSGQILVGAEGHASAVVELVLEAAWGAERERWQPSDVRLERGCTLHLSFLLGDPASPERLPLSIVAGGVRLVPEQGPAEGAQRVRASPQGSATVRGLAPGSYRLESSLPQWAFDPPVIEVAPDGASEAFVAVLAVPGGTARER